METSVQDLMMDSKLVDSGYSRMSSSNLNYSSQSNTTTNSSSSSNSLAFTSEEDEYESSNSKPCNSIIAQSTTANQFSLSLIRTNSNPVSSITSSNSETSLPSPLIQIQPNTKYVFILNAFVNGFVQLKLCADKIDYEYIIEVYWSNEAKTYIKRTFEDFVLFHRKLFQNFAQFFNELKSNKNLIKLKKETTTTTTNNNNNNRNSRFFSNGNGYVCDQDEHQIPVLPPNKKPFWVSHLKLAESREIELNKYVQRLLKLPTKVSHSALVLQFFESQSSDPKPAKYCRMRVANPNGSDSVGDDREYDYDEDEEEVDDDDDDEDGEDDENNQDDNEINSEFDEEENPAENHQDLNETEINPQNEDIFSENFETSDFNSSKRSAANRSSQSANFNVKNKKKSSNNREAGLWWDEDEALNELTSSISFEFGGGNHRNNPNNYEYDEADEEDDELETLESMLRNSDLFRAPNSAISSSSSSILRNNPIDNQCIKRLSLS